jgi:hypothetical protein
VISAPCSGSAAGSQFVVMRYTHVNVVRHTIERLPGGILGGLQTVKGKKQSN